MLLQLPLLLSTVEDPVTTVEPQTGDTPASDPTEAHRKSWAGKVTGPLKKINEEINKNRTTRLQKNRINSRNDSLLAPNTHGAPNQLRITPFIEVPEQINKQNFIIGMQSGKGDKQSFKLEDGTQVTKKNWTDNILSFITPMLPKLSDGSIYFPAP